MCKQNDTKLTWFLPGYFETMILSTKRKTAIIFKNLFVDFWKVNIFLDNVKGHVNKLKFAIPRKVHLSVSRYNLKLTFEENEILTDKNRYSRFFLQFKFILSKNYVFFVFWHLSSICFGFMFAFNNEIYQNFVKKRKEKKERGYLTFVHIGLLN